jgi:SAM-dependent methyltransferase
MPESAFLRQLATQLEERSAWPEAVQLRAELIADRYPNFWDKFAYARALLHAGRRDDAEPLITQLASESKSGAMWMLKADLLERSEKFPGALEAWEEADKSGGPLYWCLFGRARALYRLGRFAEAETVMADALCLPERESVGVEFAEAVKRAQGPAGALISLALAHDPKLESFATAGLLKELLVRLRAGDRIGTDERPITWADELTQLMADQLDIHENRFSIRRLRDFFWTFYSSVHVRPQITNASFLDIGSGSHNPLALGMLFVLLGARRAYAADLEPIQDEKRAATALARVADVLLTQAGRLVGDLPVSHEKVLSQLQGFDLDALRKGDMQGADRSRLQLLIGPASKLPLENGSIDVITSNSFLEHLEDPDEIIGEMARVTAPNGFGIHNIDGADHMMYVDRELHPLDFLRRDIPGMVNGSNRLRPLEFGALFNKRGFSVQEFIPLHKVAVDDVLRKQFTSPWRQMPDEMLEVIRGTLVVRRKG